jgi:hypothetical protein
MKLAMIGVSLAALLCAAPAVAQQSIAAERHVAPNPNSGPQSGPSGAAYTRPRTTWGAPDFQGFWNNTSITALQRPAGVPSLVVSEAQAQRIVNRNVLVVLTREDESRNGTDPQDVSQLADRNNDRGYNAFWIDPGTRLAQVRGEYRTSWITSPENGRIPYKPGAARGGGFAAADFSGPETRPLAERCLMSFSGSAGPVMQNGMYNNTMQFVQTPTSVVIDIEMNHDARIIPIVANRAAVRHGAIPRWAGDSVGWYEGDTLVVETVNVHPLQRGLITNTGKLTERFTRWSENQILYEFEVEDPTLYSQVWKGEMALNAAQPLYEYACHEGNYALHGILAGARELESKGITPTMGPGIQAGLVIPRDGEGGGEGG